MDQSSNMEKNPLTEREIRIAKIKEAIKAGTYKLNPQKVAEKLVVVEAISELLLGLLPQTEEEGHLNIQASHPENEPSEKTHK